MRAQTLEALSVQSALRRSRAELERAHEATAHAARARGAGEAHPAIFASQVDNGGGGAASHRSPAQIPSEQHLI